MLRKRGGAPRGPLVLGILALASCSRPPTRATDSTSVSREVGAPEMASPASVHYLIRRPSKPSTGQPAYEWLRLASLAKPLLSGLESVGDPIPESSFLKLDNPMSILLQLSATDAGVDGLQLHAFLLLGPDAPAVDGVRSELRRLGATVQTVSGTIVTAFVTFSRLRDVLSVPWIRR